MLSEPLKPRPDRSVLRRLEKSSEWLATASVVWHELLFGLFRLPAGAKRALIDAYLRDVVEPSIAILPYDDVAAEHHARERARLGALGAAPPFADGQIAAITRVNGLVLVTRNTRDFAAFEGLAVEDWSTGR